MQSAFLLLTVILLLIKVLLAKLPGEKLDKERIVHWLFLHYHKTGHDLTRVLCSPFNEKPCSAPNTKFFPARASLEPYIRTSPQLLSRNISILAGNELLFNWAEMFQGDIGEADAKHEFRAVHFVRDPIDMVLSAYLYHAQYPIPVQERWLLNPNFQPCALSSRIDAYGSVIADAIGIPWAEFRAWVNRAQEECLELQRITGDQVGFNQRLRMLASCDYDNQNKTYEAGRIDDFDCSPIRDIRKGFNASPGIRAAIRFEAFRSLLSKDGGDILRMAANAVFESSTSKDFSLRVFLSEFPLQDWDRYRASIFRVYEFLMCHHGWPCINFPEHVEQSQFWSHLSVRDAVDIAMDFTNSLLNNSFPMRTELAEKRLQRWESADAQILGSGGHITAYALADSTRQELVTWILNDEVLGPILGAVAAVVK